MTAVASGDLVLPRSDDLRHPLTWPIEHLRGAFAIYARRRWTLEVRGAEHVPARGPVVLAANHMGFLDGPLLAIVGPRPAHALTKRELFSGPLGAFLWFSGQIPVERGAQDPRAVRTALRVLRDDGVVGMFPETTRGGGDMARVTGGAAYLALVTGAPLVPTAFLGTRLPGSRSTFPPAGSRLVMSYGAPLEVAQQPWPRRPEDVRALTERLRQAILDVVADAERATGMSLPGPLPETNEDKT
ncbi:MAG: 1-acyl-sn-glycerol-3-phosphate acyltransferase [Nocardioidaceae bacterium]|nr:1-acyl-sn-glycerol-3-phosphate acyltransferase [Nocardioidaceae bacterium]